MSRIPDEYRAPAEVIGSYSRLLSEMRPDNLDVIHMDNTGIEDIANSAIAAEDAHALPRMVYAPCCPVMREESEQALLRG